MVRNLNLSLKDKKQKRKLKKSNYFPKLIMSASNKIVGITTKEHPNKLLLRITGDKKRYGGGADRYINKVKKLKSERKDFNV